LKLYYDGPKPSTPPRWIEEEYELNARDALCVIQQQLATPDFDSNIEYVPYQEFDEHGDRIYSNLNSAHWANKQAVGVFILHLFFRL
jgi:hypothetical protein